MRLDSSVHWVFVSFEFVNFNPFGEYAVPGECFGSMLQRLLVNALWPFAAMLCALVAVAISTFTSYKSRAEPASQRIRAVLYRAFHLSLLIVYFVLPSVSQRIFDARKVPITGCTRAPRLSQGVTRGMCGVRCMHPSTHMHI